MKTNKQFIHSLCAILIVFGIQNTYARGESSADIKPNTNEIKYDQDMLQVINDPALLDNENLDATSMQNDFSADDKDYDPKRDKILIAGDSWAVFPCLFRSLKKVLRDNESSLMNDRRCLRTSKLGMRADQWLGSVYDKRVSRFIARNHRIKYLYLSLGGNDVQQIWNKDFTPEDQFNLGLSLAQTMQKIVTHYLKINPDLKIILSGYDFLALTGKMKFYAKKLKEMKNPTTQDINNLLVKSTAIFAKLSDKKNIFFIQHLGLSQYYDGVPEHGLAPRQTLSPDQISTLENPLQIGGDPTLPSSPRSMLSWFGFARDEIHLSKRNYYHLMNHTYKNLISRIMPQPKQVTADHEANEKMKLN